MTTTGDLRAPYLPNTKGNQLTPVALTLTPMKGTFMKCPKCNHIAEPTADQVAAGGAAAASGLFVAWGGIFGMIAAPYLAPVILGGFLWDTCRTAACPNCGHRFNFWQSGSK